MQKKLIKIVASALLVSSANGCDNGFNCPMDPPSCCFNTVFGCGLFDLPAGCSCSDFLSVPIAPARLADEKMILSTKKLTFSRVPGVSGKWVGDLGRVKNSCSLALAQISGKLEIIKDGNTAKIKVADYGVLKGNVRGGLTTARGSYTRGGCRAEIGATLRTGRVGRGKSVVNATVQCGNGFACRAQFRGELRKVK